MDIRVRSFGNYKEVTYADGNVKVESGFLDVVEQKQLGISLLAVAYAVLPMSDDDSRRLDELIEDLSADKLSEETDE